MRVATLVETPLQALHCDKAYSWQQFARRWPAVQPASLPGVVVVERSIAEILKGQPLQVRFVTLEALAEEEGFTLRHLAGVAEMRYALRARGEDWVNDAGTIHLDSTPDAVWHNPEGPCAIEYDLRYNRQVVLRKQQDYLRIYNHQYWGVAVPSRALYLKRTLKPGPRTHTMLAPWYRD
jgi:hypothetical protein